MYIYIFISYFQVCFEYCSGVGSVFMATQYGKECWCSDKAELDHERHGEAVCDYDCAGDEVSSSFSAQKQSI